MSQDQGSWNVDIFGDQQSFDLIFQMSKELWCKATKWIITTPLYYSCLCHETLPPDEKAALLLHLYQCFSAEPVQWRLTCQSMYLHSWVSIHLHSEHAIRTYYLALSSDWIAAGCQSSAVICWGPTRPTWEFWTWVTTSCRIQWWCSSVIFSWTHSVNWRPSGQLMHGCFCLSWEGIRSILGVWNK